MPRSTEKSVTSFLLTTLKTEPKTRYGWFAAVGAVLLCGSLLVAFPQTSSSRNKKSSPAGSRAPQKDDDDEKKGATFGVDVNQVILNTTVLDRKTGKFVEGLRKEDFLVYEDRVEQQINSFAQEDVPITLGLVIDTSGSMRNKIDPVTKAALQFIKASNPNDEAFIISFNSEATLVEDFTGDINDLRESLDNLVVGGGTALYDAIYLGVKKAQQGHKQKRVVIVITDGEDRDSQYRFEDVLEKIREADVQVYSIGFIDPDEQRGLFDGIFRKSKEKKAHEVLQRVADETGGKSIFPKEITEIDAVVRTIAHELRNQYSVGYVSTNQVKDGSWRSVRVTLKRPDAANKYKVRTRAGYYAPKK